RGLYREGRRAVRKRARLGHPRLVARGGRADEAAREHLPLGEHRPRQRAGAALRPDGSRSLRDHRRGVDQAGLLHAFPARPRPPQRDRQERPRGREGLEAMTRLGLVGLGYWGPNLARNLDDLGELRWLCDASPDALDRYGDRYPEARTTTSYEELLADPELEA